MPPRDEEYALSHATRLMSRPLARQELDSWPMVGAGRMRRRFWKLTW